MPNTLSAAKRLRSNAKRQSLNRWRKRTVKNSEKEFLRLVKGGDADGARQVLPKCYAALDRAAIRNAIHKNKANRKKARLAARLKAIS